MDLVSPRAVSILAPAVGACPGVSPPATSLWSGGAPNPPLSI